MRPDRVVLFHDFSEALGGASFLVQVLLAQLRRLDINVTFFAGDSGERFTRSDVEFIRLGGTELLKRSKLGAMTAGLYNRDAHGHVQEWIARNDTPRTVYHVHGWSKILTPSIFTALRPVRDRLILHAHDYFNGCPNGAFFDYRVEQDCGLKPLSGACLGRQCDKSSYAHKLWRSGREALRRTTLGSIGGAARLLLIHPDQAPLFHRAGWPDHKVHAVRNPVTPPCTTRVAAESNRGIIFIGRISAEKGADLAARAALHVGLPITFVGDGAEMDNIRALNPSARLLGRLDRQGIAQALAQARVAVMPSRWSEPFGLVALEAIGSGVPAIVSQHSLVAQEIAQAGFGLALDTADITGFANALTALHADDAKVAAMSQAGHANFLSLCNTELQWAQDIVAHYNAIVS